MSDKDKPTSSYDEAQVYQIRIEGHLSQDWIPWFGNITIVLEDGGETLLTGVVIDQSALHALLRKLRDLGMPLISVNRIDPNLSSSP